MKLATLHYDESIARDTLYLPRTKQELPTALTTKKNRNVYNRVPSINTQSKVLRILLH
jgi:hypothetical protein